MPVKYTTCHTTTTFPKYPKSLFRPGSRRPRWQALHDGRSVDLAAAGRRLVCGRYPNRGSDFEPPARRPPLARFVRAAGAHGGAGSSRR